MEGVRLRGRRCSQGDAGMRVLVFWLPVGVLNQKTDAVEDEVGGVVCGAVEVVME